MNKRNKYIYIYRKHIDLQNQEIYFSYPKKNPKSLHIWENGASGWKIGDIEQVIFFNRIVKKIDRFTLSWWFSTKFCDDALK